MSAITTVAGIAMGLLILGLASVLVYGEYQDFIEKKNAKREDWRNAREKKKKGWDAIHNKMEGNN